MDIQTIELISMRAWPALEEVDYDGWRLRSAKGYTGRANSVYPFSAGMVALDEKIDHCERFYAERGLKTRFKLTAPRSLPNWITPSKRAATPSSRRPTCSRSI
ncbi:MAG: hypothetical protein IPO91_06785 [Chloroflexi bacterium]|nr:hypothetical protein [Chloroflexota bacterium]